LKWQIFLVNVIDVEKMNIVLIFSITITVCPKCMDNMDLEIRGRIERLERLQPWNQGKKRRTRRKAKALS